MSLKAMTYACAVKTVSRGERNWTEKNLWEVMPGVWCLQAAFHCQPWRLRPGASPNTARDKGTWVEKLLSSRAMGECGHGRTSWSGKPFINLWAWNIGYCVGFSQEGFSLSLSGNCTGRISPSVVKSLKTKALREAESKHSVRTGRKILNLTNLPSDCGPPIHSTPLAKVSQNSLLYQLPPALPRAKI